MDDERGTAPARQGLAPFGTAVAYGEAGARTAAAFARAGIRTVAAFLDAGAQSWAAFRAAHRAARGLDDAGPRDTPRT